MSLQSRLASLISAIGADVKSLQTQINTLNASGAASWTYLVVAADVSNSTVTAANVTGLTIPNTLSTGKYEIEGKLWYTSAAATTGVQCGFVYPSQVALSALFQIPISATANQIFNQAATATFSGGTAAPGQSPLAYVGILDGIFSVTAAMSSGITLQQRSEIANSAITTKAGSFIRYRKIAS